MLSKVYEANPAERNYSPAEVSGTGVVPISDHPDLARIQRSQSAGYYRICSPGKFGP
jgi:hypothetical protein